jgi:hypothetical protein
MLQRKVTILIAIIALLVFALPASAQQKENEPSPSEAEAMAKAFRSRVFEIKHRNPRDLLNVLLSMRSGVRGSAMTHSDQFNTITVRDYPEVLATVEEVIKRLDVVEPPAPPRPGVEFRIHILIASNSSSVTSQFPPDVADAVKQLQQTLSYKNYYMMTSQVLRYEGASRTISNKGIAEFKLNSDTAASKNPIFYEYHIQDGKIRVEGSTTRVEVPSFRFVMKAPLMVRADSLQYEEIGFNTPVTLAEGEKVVVGTTSLEDKGIIVVLSARIIR